MGGGRSNKLSCPAGSCYASSTPGPPPPRPERQFYRRSRPNRPNFRSTNQRRLGVSFTEVILRRLALSATGGSAGSRVLAGRGVRSTWPLLDWIRAVGASSSRPAGFVGRWSTRPVGLRGLPLHFRGATVALVRYNTAAIATSLYLLDWIHRCLSPARSRPNSGNFVWWYISPVKSRPRF